MLLLGGDGNSDITWFGEAFRHRTSKNLEKKCSLHFKTRAGVAWAQVIMLRHRASNPIFIINVSFSISPTAGQGFAQVRRTKAIYEYKKLLRRTRKQQQQKSSYVENVYSSELNRDATKNEDKTLSTSEDRHTTQGGEERKIEIPMGVLEKRTKNCVGEGTKVFQGTLDEKTKEPLGVVERGTIVKESTGKQRESTKALSKQV